MSEVTGLSKSKSVCVMLVVIGCFAILWPKLFYPMILCGLNWGNDAKYSMERTVSEQMLPPKVREAMRANPMRDSIKVQRLPGRPEFYTGHRAGIHGHIQKSTTSASSMNLMLPVFTIIIVIVFIFTMLKMSFSNENSEQSKSLSCKYPRNAFNSESDIARNKTSKSTLQPRNRPFQVPQPNYSLAFAKHGRKNVMESLITDMETFRDHLKQAEVCMCKIKKYESAKKAAEKCLNVPDLEVHEKDQEKDKLEKTESPEPKIESKIEETFEVGENEQKMTCSNEGEESGIEDEIEQTEESNKENAIDLIDLEQPKEKDAKVKNRKSKVKFAHIENENVDFSKDNENEDNICEQFHESLDERFLYKWNQEMERLVHLKDE